MPGWPTADLENDPKPSQPTLAVESQAAPADSQSRWYRLTKAGLGTAALVVLWVSLAYLRDKALVILYGASHGPEASGLLSQSVQQAAPPSYFLEFIGVSLALIALGIMVCWAAQDPATECLELLRDDETQATLEWQRAAEALADATACEVHLRTRDELTPERLRLLEEINETWTEWEIARAAGEDPARRRGFWSNGGEVRHGLTGKPLDLLREPEQPPSTAPTKGLA